MYFPLSRATNTELLDGVRNQDDSVIRDSAGFRPFFRNDQSSRKVGKYEFSAREYGKKFPHVKNVKSYVTSNSEVRFTRRIFAEKFTCFSFVQLNLNDIWSSIRDTKP